MPWSVRWSHGKARENYYHTIFSQLWQIAKTDRCWVGQRSSPLSSATRSFCSDTRRLMEGCETQQKETMSHNNTGSNGTHYFFFARHLQRICRDQETAVVEVVRHRWLSAAARTVELPRATAKKTPKWRPRTSPSGRSARCSSRVDIKDRSNAGPSANIAPSSGVSPSAGSAKRKS